MSLKWSILLRFSFFSICLLLVLAMMFLSKLTHSPPFSSLSLSPPSPRWLLAEVFLYHAIRKHVDYCHHRNEDEASPWNIKWNQITLESKRLRLTKSDIPLYIPNQSFHFIISYFKQLQCVSLLFFWLSSLLFNVQLPENVYVAAVDTMVVRLEKSVVFLHLIALEIQTVNRAIVLESLLANVQAEPCRV